MNPARSRCHCLPSTRRSLLRSVLAASVAPVFVPARVLGRGAEPAPNSKVTLGVIGAWEQGHSGMLAFLAQPGVPLGL
ncbi:MAG: hypothetical protein KF833_14865 [Verrucomicrobiae bacterium]|nr:hypothetical protein [Verrucomicrobiae bacterium]